MRRPGIATLHAVTATNALHYAFQHVSDDETRRYSNSNYLVLGLIIEKLTLQRFGEFLRENVLDPLGLKDTGVDSNLRILPRRASGYTRHGDEIRNASYNDMTVPHAAGAMYSSTHDLWRWAEAIFGDKLLTPASRTKLLTPVENDYALGVRVAVSEGRKRIDHGGSIAGFSSFLAHYPDESVTVVVLSNLSTRNAAELGYQLATAFFNNEEEPKPNRSAHGHSRSLPRRLRTSRRHDEHHSARRRQPDDPAHRPAGPDASGRVRNQILSPDSGSPGRVHPR